MKNLHIKIMFLLTLLILISSSLVLANMKEEATFRGFHEPLFTNIIKHYEGLPQVYVAENLDINQHLLVNRSLVSQGIRVGTRDGTEDVSYALHIRSRLLNEGHTTISRDPPSEGPFIDLYGQNHHRLRIAYSEQQDAYEIKTESTSEPSTSTNIVLNPSRSVTIGTPPLTAPAWQTKLHVTGTSRIRGELDMDNSRIMNVRGPPEYSHDVVNKEYVDSIIEGLSSLWDYQPGSTVNIQRTNDDVIVSQKLGVNLENLQVQEKLHVRGILRVTDSFYVGNDEGATGSISYINEEGFECTLEFTKGIIIGEECVPPCTPLSCLNLDELAELNDGLNCGLNLDGNCGTTLHCLNNCDPGQVCTYDHAGIELIFEEPPQQGYCAHDTGCNPVIEVGGVPSAGRKFCIRPVKQTAPNVCVGEAVQEGPVPVTILDYLCTAGGTLCSNFFSYEYGITWLDETDGPHALGYFAVTEDDQTYGEYYVEYQDITFSPKPCPVPPPPSIEDVEEEFTATSTGREGTIQTWTAEFTGTYRITAYGAQGGGNVGGLGAKMSGDFVLQQGDFLKILVGQRGVGDGGGGGTFVTETDNTPLIISGGGGSGTGTWALSHGTTSNDGQPGSLNGVPNSDGGTEGLGGSSNSPNNVDGGGGLIGDGFGSHGGLAFVNGGLGGDRGTNIGGFGGGGGRRGGGGGYSGGGAGGWGWGVRTGGGGGSYNNGFNQDNEGGVREGHGLVIIEGISSSTSEPEGEGEPADEEDSDMED